MDLITYGNTQQYLVIDEYKSAYTFSSLREIGDNLKINYSTIAKKINNLPSCIVKSKQTDITYYVKRLI